MVDLIGGERESFFLRLFCFMVGVFVRIVERVSGIRSLSIVRRWRVYYVFGICCYFVYVVFDCLIRCCVEFVIRG